MVETNGAVALDAVLEPRWQRFLEHVDNIGNAFMEHLGNLIGGALNKAGELASETAVHFKSGMNGLKEHSFSPTPPDATPKVAPEPTIQAEKTLAISMSPEMASLFANMKCQVYDVPTAKYSFSPSAGGSRSQTQGLQVG